MTNKELRELLETFPDDLPVRFWDSNSRKGMLNIDKVQIINPDSVYSDYYQEKQINLVSENRYA